MNTSKTWAKGLLAAVIGGASNAALLVLVMPEKFAWNDLADVGRIAAAGALISLFSYLKQSPLPNGKANEYR